MSETIGKYEGRTLPKEDAKPIKIPAVLSPSTGSALSVVGVAIYRNGTTYTKAFPAMHVHLLIEMEENGVEPGFDDKLFLLSNGRTCSLEAAANVAYEAGQIDHRKSKLYSDDIKQNGES